MRVIGGSARGRQLAAFTGKAIRPTPDRVREALFNILFSRFGPCDGSLVLDLFAGSGALGIEALSRGARQAWFVDSSRQAVATITRNLERCGLTDRASVLALDLWRALPGLVATGPYDLVFADPPYGHEAGPRLLNELATLGLLARDGLVCLETAANDPVPARSGALQLVDQRRYGSTMLHIFHLSSAEEA